MQRLAVYGTLRRGYGNHAIIQGAEYIGLFVVKHHEMYSTGAFPYIHYTPCMNVVVEVYDVSHEQFVNTDMLEGYPSHYQRKVVPYFESKDSVEPAGMTWIYYVTDEPTRQSDVIMDGNWETYVAEKEAAYAEREAKRKSQIQPARAGVKTYKHGYYQYDPSTGRTEYQQFHGE